MLITFRLFIITLITTVGLVSNSYAQSCTNDTIESGNHIANSAGGCGVEDQKNYLGFTNTEVSNLVDSFKALAKDHKFKHVYFGITGPSDGMGALGHGFFVFTEEKENFFNSKGFQYNLLINLMNTSQNAGESLNGLDLLDQVIDSPSFLKMDEGLEMIRHYTAESRVVLLYRVDLSESDVDEIFKSLIDEMSSLYKNKGDEYNVVYKNCVTRNIDILNKYLDQAYQLNSNWSEEGFSFKKGLSLSSLTANVPLTLAPRLEEHPRFEAPVMLRPDTFYDVKLGAKFINIISDMGKNCAWSEGKTNSYSKLIINRKIRSTNAFLSGFKKEVNSCSHAKVGFNEAIKLIALMSKNYDLRGEVLKFLIK